ncbi:MAG: L,D-transpeptidase family protein, partial [Planctomycetota bacterium]|nr:L,D-transpeptidase family protein [Planctomycetota bacterium]
MGAIAFALLAVGFLLWAVVSDYGGKAHAEAPAPATLSEAPAAPVDVPDAEDASPAQRVSFAPERPGAPAGDSPTAPGEDLAGAPGLPEPGDAEPLLREMRFEALRDWLKKADLPRSGPQALHWTVVEARALAGAGEWALARERFAKAAESGDDAHPEWIEQSMGAPVDGAFGELWCKAKGDAGKIPDAALKEIADCPYESWGRAMASFLYAERCALLFPKGVCVAESLPYLQKALLSNRLDAGSEKPCAEAFRAAVDRTLFDPACLLSALRKPVFHEVAAGESIFRIAKQYDVDPGQIVRLNRLDAGSALFVGKKLKIVPGPVTVKVDRARLVAYLCFDGVALRRYPVCIGPGEKTPAGTFTIRTKVANPDWWWKGKKYPYGSPENILGTRWLGFDGEENGGKGAGIGLHGTTKPETIPGRESLGCVRFLNADIEEVYAFLPAGG